MQVFRFYGLEVFDDERRRSFRLPAAAVDPILVSVIEQNDPARRRFPHAGHNLRSNRKYQPLRCRDR